MSDGSEQLDSLRTLYDLGEAFIAKMLSEQGTYENMTVSSGLISPVRSLHARTVKDITERDKRQYHDMSKVMRWTLFSDDEASLEQNQVAFMHFAGMNASAIYPLYKQAYASVYGSCPI